MTVFTATGYDADGVARATATGSSADEASFKVFGRSSVDAPVIVKSFVTSKGLPTLKVLVHGPNLRTTGSAIHVHSASCSDNGKKLYRNEEPWEIDATSLRDVVEAVYPSSDFGYDAETEWWDFAADVKFFPCTFSLPE